jgi:hypothetical protein
MLRGIQDRARRRSPRRPTSTGRRSGVTPRPLASRWLVMRTQRRLLLRCPRPLRGPSGTGPEPHKRAESHGQRLAHDRRCAPPRGRARRPLPPRRPAETVLYKLARQNLESFLAYAREHYDGGLPRYVEQEFRAYLACGDFSRGFTRLSCEACGHDLLVAFSCGSRSICPSCTGRRMANVAAFLVDRVVPDVPVRQYVLTLPYELRKLVAFKADVLTAVARIFVESVFASYRGRARRDGIEDAQSGSINFVQRFGSLNLHCHFHPVALDGVFARDAGGQTSVPPGRDADGGGSGRHRRACCSTRDHLAAQVQPPRRAAARSALERASRADGARRLRGHRHGARQRDDDAT